MASAYGPLPSAVCRDVRRRGSVFCGHVGDEGPRRRGICHARHVGRVLARLRAAAVGVLRGDLAAPTGAFPSLGYWFLMLAAITWVGAVAAMAESKALTAVLGVLAAGATVDGIGNLLGNGTLTVAAGYLFMLSAVCAWYTASALMLESAFKRPVLSVGKTVAAQQASRLDAGFGEPGVIRGQ